MSGSGSTYTDTVSLPIIFTPKTAFAYDVLRSEGSVFPFATDTTNVDTISFRSNGNAATYRWVALGVV